MALESKNLSLLQALLSDFTQIDGESALHLLLRYKIPELCEKFISQANRKSDKAECIRFTMPFLLVIHIKLLR